MKLNLHLSVAVAGLLAAAAPALADDWECYRETGNGHEALRQARADFDGLFGTDLLTVAGSQCYYSICNGNVFGLCNESSQTRTERPDERGQAADADPGIGSMCRISFGPLVTDRLGYWFAREGDIYICEGDCGQIQNSVRRC